jgi:hypothetical protein
MGNNRFVIIDHERYCRPFFAIQDSEHAPRRLLGAGSDVATASYLCVLERAESLDSTLGEIAMVSDHCRFAGFRVGRIRATLSDQSQLEYVQALVPVAPN